MKTRLDFDGPEDLSIGRIRITGSAGVLRDWIATPGESVLKAEDIEPGFYMAEISPAGVQPQSVVFEVRDGEDNAIKLPDFSALMANGAAMTFLGAIDKVAAARSLFGVSSERSFNKGISPPDLGAENAGFGTIVMRSDGHGPPTEAHHESAPAKGRLLTVALAMERPDRRESWTAFTGSCNARISPEMLQLTIDAPKEEGVLSGQRVRLTVAVQDLRVERLLLPIYAGGTVITITPSAQSANDVGLEVTPRDPSIRAIWRVVDSGTPEHAEAVRDQILGPQGTSPFAAIESSDPWTAVLVGLLHLRYPEQLGPLDHSWTAALVERAPWMADSYIIRAKGAALAAAENPDCVREHAIEASRMLIKAHACNSPYFSQSNLYFNELVESLAAYEDLPGDIRGRILRTQRRWQRELPLKRSDAVSFSWLSRDQRVLREKGILAPKRDASGRLPRHSNTIVFEGRVTGGIIALAGSGARRGSMVSAHAKSLWSEAHNERQIAQQDAAAPAEAPALSRPSGPADDPNLGRFGSSSERGGFRLSANFPEKREPYVPIVITVTAGEDAMLEVGDSVWLCLHPTFRPQWLRLDFNRRVVSQAVRAWGGFTVGAWLPRQGIELECDLSKLPGAPKVVRER